MTTISIVLAETARDVTGSHVERGLVPVENVELEIVEARGATIGDAMDRGFSGTRGDIVGFIGASDALLPGALESIASAVTSERRVVLGRTLLHVDGFDAVAVRHPSEYRDHLDHLRVWRRGFNSVPLASLFWHRTVLPELGTLRAIDPEALEYEIALRLGARHGIAAVDADWAVRRVSSETARADDVVLDALVRASRAYWGSWLGPRRWRCEASYRAWRLQWHDHARHHARLAENARAAGDGMRARYERFVTSLYSPQMARGRFDD